MTKKNNKTAAVFSSGILRIPSLKEFLGVTRILHAPGQGKAKKIDLVVGWGCKNNTAEAKQYAEKNNLPYLRLEDGFLRSVGLGVDGQAPLSLVIDDAGIYYDATGPSRLENTLNEKDASKNLLKSDALILRAKKCIERIVDFNLSKYNNSPTKDYVLPKSKYKKCVLVIDQTFGDVSITKGMVPENGFDNMLKAALDENPDAQILVKTHPDVLAGKKRGYLTLNTFDSRIKIISEFINPVSLIKQVDKVYTATSQMGFEALMVGREVTCFGVPFYAGWGLTDDRVKIERRSRARSLEELFAAAYILYPKYLNPETGKLSEIESVISHLQLQRYYFKQNSGKIFCFGFSIWKHYFVHSFLKSPGNQIHFVKTAQRAEKKGFDSKSRIIVWGIKEIKEVKKLSQKYDVKVWRMEDGFLRSIGLGSDLNTPSSLVIDKQGIYFNPNEPSDLESILENNEFSDVELKRAKKLTAKIIASKISKYNVGADDNLKLPTDAGKPVILVPGQVENDASIQLGCVDIKTNADLLRATRKAKPDAHIIYKPHPDVLSGNRKGKVSKDVTDEICCQVIEDVSLADCLDIADEVHTMTSLVGFEALIRKLPVSVYGLPFYSGWGLTNDRHKIKRRTRKLKLDELVAATLIKYPRYVNINKGVFTTPEVIVDSLEKQILSKKTAIKTFWHVRQLRKLKQVLKAIFHIK